MTPLRKLLLACMIAAVSLMTTVSASHAASATDLDKDSNQALSNLYKTNPLAADIAKSAKAVLVFPNIVKAGLIFGGGYGEGELLVGNRVEDYFNTVTGSWGFQVGAQSYGYAVFLMNDNTLDYLRKSHGWEIGVGPTVVMVNAGVAKNLSSTTLKDDAYAFIFDQQGLMAGISLEGTKVTKIKR